MTSLFISDLHLSATQPELTKQFISLLTQAKEKAEAIYILGDLFDRWIGDDNNEAYLQPIYAALKNITEKIPCYFIAGNRDFLLGETFAKKTGMTLLTEPTLINLYDTPTLLMHGDLLCIEDKKYQDYRLKVRRPKTMKRFLRLPLFIRKSIALLLRSLSTKHQKQQNLSYLDANQSEILRLLTLYQADCLIYGHTHQPGIHLHYEQGLCKRWFVLGDWHQKQSSILWVDQEQFYLEQFSIKR